MNSPHLKRVFSLLLLLLPFSLSAAEIQVQSYSLPACHEASSSFRLEVSGVDIPVVKLWGVYEYAHYSFAGRTTVTVTVSQSISSYRISPLTYGIEGQVNGKTLRFELGQSRYLIVKINDYPDLVIAADDLETDVPLASGNGIYNIVSDYGADASGKTLCTKAIQDAIDAASKAGNSTVYIPEGVYLSSNLILKSNINVYLALGAVIRATGEGSDYRKCYRKNSIGLDGTWFIFTNRNAENIRIYGRGIIDGNGYNMRFNAKTKMLMTLLMPLQCSNFTVDGILFRDSGLWGTTLTRSNDLNFFNTKHFNENDRNTEDDAIDVQESQRVLFRHSIAISEDDTYSTKTWTESTDIADNWWGNPENLDHVVFDDCVAWSRCATFKVGFGVCQPQNNIVFKNSVSYRSMRAVTVNHKYCPAPAANITFENIDIEGFWPRTGSSHICRWLEFDMEYEGGTVDGIHVKNIRVRNVGMVPSLINGLSATTPIRNITLENIYMNNNATPAKTLQEMNITNTNSFVENLKIIAHTTGIVSSAGQPLISVYPNPVDDKLYIRNKPEQTEALLFGATGQPVYRTFQSEIPLMSFPKGIYFVKTGMETFKIIKR